MKNSNENTKITLDRIQNWLNYEGRPFEQAEEIVECFGQNRVEYAITNGLSFYDLETWSILTGNLEEPNMSYETARKISNLIYTNYDGDVREVNYDFIKEEKKKNMKTFYIHVTEEYHKVVTVEAETWQDAETKVEIAFDNDEIEMAEHDFVDRTVSEDTEHISATYDADEINNFEKIKEDD